MKKKIILLVAAFIVAFGTMTVYADEPETGKCTTLQNACTSISTNIDVKLPQTVYKVILVIEIAVPVLLVIFGMLDLFKGITAQKEDEIKKGQQTFLKRLLAAALVFFVIVIVKLLIGFVAGNDEEDITKCASCFINGVNSSCECNKW